jgi:predicted ATPase
LELLQLSLDRYERAGWTIQHSELVGALAEGLSALGRQAEALRLIDSGVARLGNGIGRWYLPELLRIKGEAQRKNGSGESTEAAEACLMESLAIAQGQGALFWELRIASSLARLWASQRRYGEAHTTLASVCGRFTEGFETADLVSARALLDAMPSSSA